MRAHLHRWRSARRRPVIYWTVAAVVAVATGGGAATLVGQAEQWRQSWGPGRPVAVATRDLGPGSALGPADVRWEVRPSTLTPSAALGEGATIDGRVVVAPIVEGEPIVSTRLAPDGLRGLAARLPPGTTAIAIPATARPPRVQVGDLIDLFTGPGRGAAGLPAGAVARAATVVDTSDDGAVTVAVRRDEAPAAAAAVLDGSLVVALDAPGR